MNIIASTLLVLAASTAAQATLISGFGNPSSSTVLNGGTVIDFDGGPTGFFYNYSIGDITFSTSDSVPFEVGRDFDGAFNASEISLYSRLAGPQSLVISFSTPVDAFGFNWGGTDFLWELRAFNSASALIDTVLLPAVESSNVGDFFGISAPDISFATLTRTTDSGDISVIDNFTFVRSVTSNVPSGGTTALMLLGGLLGLAGLQRGLRSA